MLSPHASTKPASRRRFFFEGTRAMGFAAVAAALLAGCEQKPGGPPGGAGGGPGGPGGPMEVGVFTVEPKQVTLTQELPGRISALRMAEVRARVNGIVQKRLFTEGSDVREGQLLYEIDPAPYQAALDSAKGALARSEANLTMTSLKEERSKQLIDTKAISKQEYDDAVAAQRSANADVLSGRAAVQAAQINLDYTKVTSPVSGRIGISQMTEGAYVQASAATLLATVQQLDRVYVDVTQSSSELLRLKRELASGKLKVDEKGQTQVKLLFEDGTAYPEMGTLEMSDVTVNPATDSVTIRAVFPNPRRELLPGMFVRAQIQEGSAPDAILVPQLAVSRNVRGEPTALVIGAENKAELRMLQTSRAVGNQWLVTSGLKAGDQVIIDSFHKVRPGVPVKPAPPAANPPPSGAPAAPGAGAH